MSGAGGRGKVTVIAGAGPAGLTAALELLRRSDIKPIVLESAQQVGGISKTVNYRGNRMDLGGHRFFSKSDWVMRWWQDILPVAEGQVDAGSSSRIHYHNQSREWTPSSLASRSSSAVMLIRQRISRIFYRRRFFDYPLKLSGNTLRNLGFMETLLIGASYGRARLNSRQPESSLEDFFINRFGSRLYQTFFKAYTEKVWGVSCREISAEWGAQRIKGLSVTKAVAHALKSPFRGLSDTAQRQTETSLIERFLYPRLGPGQMWEEVARRVTALGGQVELGQRVVGIVRRNFEITGIDVKDENTGAVRHIACDSFISTMPVRDLIGMLAPDDTRIHDVAMGLPYRDFMTAGLLLKRMRAVNKEGSGAGKSGMPPDNWIYIQEPDVKIGRLQIFNNWSPALVADPDTIWLGLEYFCREGDDLWSMGDHSFLDFAASELDRIGLISRNDVLDGTVVRVPKAYPAYFGEYKQIGALRTYLNQFGNLYSVGRNGMHRYNNQDHSMLAANCAVTSLIHGGTGKSAIWDVNAEETYHETDDGAVPSQSQSS